MGIKAEIKSWALGLSVVTACTVIGTAFTLMLVASWMSPEPGVYPMKVIALAREHYFS